MPMGIWRVDAQRHRRTGAQRHRRVDAQRHLERLLLAAEGGEEKGIASKNAWMVF